MKSIKRIIALLLTAVMTMTMSVTAFAADTNCSLTVNVKGGQDLNGQTISLYQWSQLKKLALFYCSFSYYECIFVRM